MTTFAEELQNRLSNIEKRAKATGSNITQVCKKTGIARATYERWRERAPQSISKVDELEAEVQRLEAAAAQAAPQQ